MKKLVEDKEMSKTKRNSLLDIAINMVMYVDTKRMGQVCQYVAPLLQVCGLNDMISTILSFHIITCVKTFDFPLSE